VYETDRFWVKRLPTGGYEVYETGVTASTRVSQIGYPGKKGLERAKLEIARREERSPMHANARWTTAYKNSLPDSAFLFVDTACVHSRDRQGRSHPLNCRHFPYKDRAGKISLSHVRNAIGRAPQSNLPLKVQREVQVEARRVLARHGGYESEPETQEVYAMAANVSIRIPKIPRWKQISGDMSPGAYGALIARSDGDALELREIQPVREAVGDGEAEEVGFPFWSKEAYYDLDDLSPSREEVQHALQAMDIDLEGGTGAAGDPEWTPENRALAIAEALMRYGSGVDEGPAGWSTDVVPGEVEWWSGVGGPEFISDEDQEFRTDILGEEEEDDEFESNPRGWRRAGWQPLRPVQPGSGDLYAETISEEYYGIMGHGNRWWAVAVDEMLARPGEGFATPDAAAQRAEQLNRSYTPNRRSRRNPRVLDDLGGRDRGYWRSSKAISGELGGKFDTELDEMVYNVSLDGGGDEEVGDADALGFALIMRDGPGIAEAIQAHRGLHPDERDFLKEEGRAGVLIFIDSAGFVQVVYYDNARELEEDWTKTVEELSVEEE